ncbi:hypothetical protein SmJEL517_g04671 [Synchytrium microbalum]|uniref:Acid phosphatase n=1 Tax=Synchytrium microbalum TaxID=1806994 RepID=A0A507C249_9FUNG|nr:uncharacterized protein SmJEL517_g04671 [Synchytrium microbalum]TPX32164.1 hypothetical protein SmJEL517_g04671 [Synchytrium microbalum]
MLSWFTKDKTSQSERRQFWQKQPTGKWFDTILIINLENTNYEDAIINLDFLQQDHGAVLLTNFHGLTHPSQGNYIGQIYGSLGGVLTDANYDVDGVNLVDLLEVAGVSWKSYNEGFPGSGFQGARKDAYVRKHNPFISMNNIRTNTVRVARIVSGEEFQDDLLSNKLPQFCFYTPDMLNDGHDTSIEYAANWVSKFLPPILSALQQQAALIVLTFDESANWFGRNKVATYLMGSSVVQQASDPSRYNHYSILKTVEENWSLGSLNRHDVTAKSFESSLTRPSKFWFH